MGIETFGPVIVGIGTEMHLKKNDGNRKRGMPLQEPEFRYASNGLLDTTLNVEPMVYKAGPLTFHTRTYEGKIPGPTLVISSGDILKITLNNTLEDINNAPPQEPLFNVPAEPNSTNLHTYYLHTQSIYSLQTHLSYEFILISILSYFFFVLDKKQHTVPGAPGKLHKQQQQKTQEKKKRKNLNLS